MSASLDRSRLRTGAGTDRNSRPMWTEYRMRLRNAAFAAGKCPAEEALERWRALQDSNLRPSDS